KPESEVSVSPTSSAQSRKQDDKTKKKAKEKSHVESFIGYRDLSSEFEDCSDNSINEVNAAGTIVPTVRLQALVDKKKIVIIEATIRDALRLDDTEGVDCLPNEEIFGELARMGYEKPSTKLTFYKAFFSSQWKFLIHTILQCMSAKRTSWNEFSSSIASAVICLSS
nr:synaptobrevin, longin-like domain protein [Tanacetum cinerariifolium]